MIESNNFGLDKMINIYFIHVIFYKLFIFDFIAILAICFFILATRFLCFFISIELFSYL
jgi:hypothetical protein